MMNFVSGAGHAVAHGVLVRCMPVAQAAPACMRSHFFSQSVLVTVLVVSRSFELTFAEFELDIYQVGFSGSTKRLVEFDRSSDFTSEHSGNYCSEWSFSERGKGVLERRNEGQEARKLMPVA